MSGSIPLDLVAILTLALVVLFGYCLVTTLWWCVRAARCNIKLYRRMVYLGIALSTATGGLAAIGAGALYLAMGAP